MLRLGDAIASQEFSASKTRDVFPPFGSDEETKDDYEFQSANTVLGRIDSPSLEKFQTSNEIDNFEFQQPQKKTTGQAAFGNFLFDTSN